METYGQLLGDIETHNVNGLQSYFVNGGDANGAYNGTPIFTSMVEMYLRSPRFKDCVRVFIDAGLIFADRALLSVLSNDIESLEQELHKKAGLVHKKYNAFNNAFTSLNGATLLHYCAEYNHHECAELLVRYGADVNAAAEVDKNGFGGHTPIFHTVNQHNNNSADMLKFLIKHGANPLYSIKGLIWGEGYEWETFIPAVNPISYAMMGVLPQMHRNPVFIAQNISFLIERAYGITYHLPNIPNVYLK